jgi:HlyD family secretion protein
MELMLHFNAYKTSQRVAHLEKIAAKGTEEQGVMKYYIEASFGMAHDTLLIRSGYTANAEIILQKKQNILAIDEKDLQFQNDSAYVEVLNSEQKFEKRFVSTGLSDGIKIEIVKGLNKNDKIKVLE